MKEARQVADWFHEREGNLFTRDEHPFDREEVVQVVNDSVDPVQQMEVEGEKHVGVLSFDERDGWYEYTRWDDAAGEVNVGVCARCVQEATSTDEVARTLDEETEAAEEKFLDHYDEEHDEAPETVETGAVLLSGTSISGNEAIHLGNDGAGSGVDADVILGNDPLLRGSFFSVEGPKRVVSRFSSPSFAPQGVGFDTQDCLWHANSASDSIYKFEKSGNLLLGFASPSSRPTGLGVGSDDCLWSADRNAKSIYKLDQTGSVLTGFASPSFGPSGIGLDAGDSIWHTDTSAASIYQFDQTGGLITQFDFPTNIPRGMGIDSGGSLWSADNGADLLYQFDTSGNRLRSFATPRSAPYGVGLDSNDSIWVSDDDPDDVFQLTQEEFIRF